MNGFGLLLLILAVLMVAANYWHEGRHLDNPSTTENDYEE